MTVDPRRKLGGGSRKAMRTRYVRVTGIGLRRNLANSALDLNRGKKLQADAKRQTNPQRDREIRPDVDDRLSDVRARDSDHSLARSHHLSNVRAHRSDNAGEIGLQLRIAKLLECFCQIRLGVSDRCFGAGPDLLCVVQRLPGGCVGARSACVCAAPSRSPWQAEPRFRELCSCRPNCELERNGIDRSDSLALGNRVPEFDRTCDETSQHAEREISLELRFYRADEARIRPDACGFDHHREHRPNWLRQLRILLASGCRQQASHERGNDRRPGSS